MPLYRALGGSRRGRDFGLDFGSDFGRDFGRDFGLDFGRDFGRDFGPDFGRDFGRDSGPDFKRDFGATYTTLGRADSFSTRLRLAPLGADVDSRLIATLSVMVRSTRYPEGPASLTAGTPC